MKTRTPLFVLLILIILLSGMATSIGIFYVEGTGEQVITSVRGEQITLYGIGLYQHMSADVAIQGIAQDYITLFFGIPLLIIALLWSRSNSTQSKLFLAGILNYFFVTYLFYMNMAMYNALFLVYVALTSLTFFALILTILQIDLNGLPNLIKKDLPRKFIGSFLIINSLAIALLWFGIVIPPLLDGTIIPSEVAHYTTLVVQGFDLSLLLPLSFLAGFLLLKRNKFGYLMTGITIIFLPLLMTALIAKIVAMALAGVNLIPVIFIIPSIALVAYLAAFSFYRNILE